MNRKGFLTFTISFSLVVLCVSASMGAYLLGFTLGSEQFLKGFDLAVGSLIGSTMTLATGYRKE